MRTWVEIDRDALARNLGEIRKVTRSDAEIMAVVKANAYGHGAIEVAKVVISNGIGKLAVAICEEGIQLRQAGINIPILVLGATFLDEAETIAAYDLMATITTYKMALALSSAAKKLGKRIKVYIKLETGMNRIGISVQEAVDFIKELTALNGLEIEGIFSHFSTADQKDKGYVKIQIGRFLRIVNDLEAEGFSFLYSLANSAAIVDLPETHLDFVRPGIILYGVYPSCEVKHHLLLHEVLHFKTRIVHLKHVKKGEPVSYGNTYITSSDTRIATLPVGYADGYSRNLSNRGSVLIGGKRYPIAGRICMDQCMVEVGLESNVSAGDEVVLIGNQGKESITVDEMADLVGTIPYVIFCGISNRVPRVYIGEGKSF